MTTNDKIKMYWRLAEKHGYRTVIAFLVRVISGDREEEQAGEIASEPKEG